MGARRLRDWLSQPLATLRPIVRRQEAVGRLMEQPAGLEQLRQQLGQVRDLERTIGRLSAGSGNGRDLQALRLALEQLPGLKQALRELGAGNTAAPTASLQEEILGEGAPAPGLGAEAGPSLLAELEERVVEMPELVELISRGVVDEPPLALKEGGLIRDGFDAALDELRTAMREGKDWIARLQQEEISRSGIQSLTGRFNSVFGY